MMKHANQFHGGAKLDLAFLDHGQLVPRLPEKSGEQSKEGRTC
jgi:hypothetical protein